MLILTALQVATGLLAVMAIVHFIITVILSVLVVWVRCYCKRREGGGAGSSKDLTLDQPNSTLEPRAAEKGNQKQLVCWA